MKGTMWCRLGYVCCALAGCLAGVGLFALSGTDEIKPNTVTKDNTLVRGIEGSVFFDAANEESNEVTPTVTPAAQLPEPVSISGNMPQSEITLIPEITPEHVKEPEHVKTLVQEIITPTPAVPVEPEKVSEDKPESSVEDMPSLANQWVNSGLAVVPTPVPATETITYPAKIFGQTPVINRSDAYVSYFEFAYDLISMLEPEVTARGQNMNVLLTKFAVKALLCGVDIEQLDINAPIPRRLAALALWLAAQVLNESGCNTSAKSAQKYVTDISGCSSSERKAIAYLYEQGIVKGYQTAGQQFYPDAGLKTGLEGEWLSCAKRCWK